jgi:hypothetical protein
MLEIIFIIGFAIPVCLALGFAIYTNCFKERRKTKEPIKTE